MKTCPLCKTEYGAESKFCTACGGKLVDKQDAARPSSGISLGDKNVISGEVIGSKEDYRISGNATIVKNEDQTKAIRTCAVCGKTMQVLESMNCPRCAATVCGDHYDVPTRQCHNCLQGARSESEQKYMGLVQQAMSDNRIDAGERRQLDEERRRLNLSEERAKQLESCARERLSVQGGKLDRREEMRLAAARQMLLEKFDVDGALEILTPLYARWNDTPEVWRLYLTALGERDLDEALRLVKGMQFDDRDKSLIHIDLLARLGEFDQAAEELRSAKSAFGEEDPALMAMDVELSLDEYIATARDLYIEEARQLAAILPKDSAHERVILVKAYLDFVSGQPDALDQALSELRRRKLSTFLLLRLKKRLPSSTPSAEVEAASGVPDSVTSILAADMEEMHRLHGRGESARPYLAEVSKEHLAAWSSAASAGIPEGLLLYGIALGDGFGISADRSQAQALLAQASARGMPEANVWLSDLEPDESKKRQYRAAAAESGYANAQYQLGHMLAGGVGGPADAAEAAKWYRNAAEQRHPTAQNGLGFMYLVGRGVEKDDAEAMKWFRLAAEQGNADAQNSLGFMYFVGRGVAHDDAEAVKWFRLAAEQGNADAQSSLGFMYFGGHGVEKDYAEAVKWFRLAAAQGNADGQRYLGLAHSLGFGVTEDQAEAARWYRLAAEQGDADAQRCLGGMYDSGRGVAEDCAEAVKWYRLAAEKGNADAQSSLGDMYDFGRGVVQDCAEAVKWYRLAAEQGHKPAQCALDRFDALPQFVTDFLKPLVAKGRLAEDEEPVLSAAIRMYRVYHHFMVARAETETNLRTAIWTAIMDGPRSRGVSELAKVLDRVQGYGYGSDVRIIGDWLVREADAGGVSLPHDHMFDLFVLLSRDFGDHDASPSLSDPIIAWIREQIGDAVAAKPGRALASEQPITETPVEVQSAPKTIRRKAPSHVQPVAASAPEPETLEADSIPFPNDERLKATFNTWRHRRFYRDHLPGMQSAAMQSDPAKFQGHIRNALDAGHGEALARLREMCWPVTVELISQVLGDEFEYVAMGSNGQDARGTVRASSQSEAVAQIRKLGLFPTTVRQKR